MNIADKVVYRGVEIIIKYDNDPIRPDEFLDDSIILLSQHRDFYIKNDNIPIDDVYSAFTNKELYDNKYKIYPISIYSHSGVALSIGESNSWDISFSALLLLDINEINNPDDFAKSYIKEWNSYLSGQVYGVNLFEESAYGFYSIYETISVAKHIIDDEYIMQVGQHCHMLKRMIKNKVPLIYRKPFKLQL